MRDPRIAYTEKDRPKLTLEEVRLQFAREVYLMLLRTGYSPNRDTWLRAEWSAEQAFPK